MLISRKMKYSELEQCDRMNLKQHYTKLYRLKMPWADDSFIRILVKWNCDMVTENMDQEAYLRDLELRYRNEDLLY